MPVWSYAEEIERKTLEAAERLVLRHEQGVLDNRTFRIAMDALNDATSGLVEPMTDIMGDVVAMDLKPEPIDVVMSDGKQVFVLRRQVRHFEIHNALSGAVSNHREFDTEVEALDHQRRVADMLAERHFRKL